MSAAAANLARARQAVAQAEEAVRKEAATAQAAAKAAAEAKARTEMPILVLEHEPKPFNEASYCAEFSGLSVAFLPGVELFSEAQIDHIIRNSIALKDVLGQVEGAAGVTTGTLVFSVSQCWDAETGDNKGDVVKLIDEDGSVTYVEPWVGTGILATEISNHVVFVGMRLKAGIGAAGGGSGGGGGVRRKGAAKQAPDGSKPGDEDAAGTKHFTPCNTCGTYRHHTGKHPKGDEDE